MESSSRPSPELLIVDDSAPVREIIMGNLKEKFPSLRFREAENGNQALDMVNERVPDMVLLDLRMPGLNGFALTRLLRTRDRTRHVPVIVISGLSDSVSVRKAVEAGATDYCVKPINFDQLGKKIAKILLNNLHGREVEVRQRSTPRRRVLCSASAVMPVCYPERDGVWIDSNLEMEEGDPLLFNGERLFRALRIQVENPFWWSRVDHCHLEKTFYRVKLLFERDPEEYVDQLRVINRSKDRFQRNFGSSLNTVHLEFPVEIRNISGEGALLAGSLPWAVGKELAFDIGDLVRSLSMSAPLSVVKAVIRWTQDNSREKLAGIHFTDLDEELRNQLMAWCLQLPLRQVLDT